MSDLVSEKLETTVKLPYPKDIMPEDCDLVAATIHYYVATLQNMPVDPSDIEIDYNCDLSDVEKEILALKQLEC